MNKHTGRWSALLLLSAAIVAGCSDSVVDPTTGTTSSSTDALYQAAYVNEAVLSDFSEIPTVDAALFDAPDSTCPDSTGLDSLHHPPRGGRDRHHRFPGDDTLRGGGPPPPPPGGDTLRGGGPPPPPPGDWRHRGGHDDFGPIGFRDYVRVIRQLNLTAEQDSLLRVYLGDLRDCAMTAAEGYQADRQAAFEQFKSVADQIHAAVQAGTVTREQARAVLDSAMADYRASVQPLNEAVRAAVDQCRTSFEDSFTAILTSDQLALWNSLKG